MAAREIPRAQKRQLIKDAKAALAAAVRKADPVELADAIARARNVGVKADIVTEAEEALARLVGSAGSLRLEVAPEPTVARAVEAKDEAPSDAAVPDSWGGCTKASAKVQPSCAKSLAKPRSSTAEVQPKAQSQAEAATAAVFARFDANGDGAIDRTELALIFQNLDEQVWDDAKLARLFASMDMNRDGRIHLGEFLGWIFRPAAGTSSAKGPTSSLHGEVCDALQKIQAGNAIPNAASAEGARSDSTAREAISGKGPAAASGPAELPQASNTYYMYRGVSYSSFEDFVTAARLDSSEHPPLHELTGDLVESRVRALFHVYAGKRLALRAGEYRGLAASLAAELGMDPRRFGDLSVTFDRFDVNGDGLLDEEESVMLAESILRHYVDELLPRSAHQVSMINLCVKNLEEHYKLSKKLGEGGQGAVYFAHERSSEQPRVVKFYDKRNTNAPLDEIRQEFMILRSLDHPKIQRLYDIFEDRSNVYVVAEPYYGGHLGDLMETALDAGASVTSVYLAKVMYQALQGVAYLHSKYILHCDIKESNLMITSREIEEMREPSLVVIDFGLARNFVVSGASGGTPGYMPPEVWKDGLWSPKGDVHSLGVVLFQLFANGEKCFPGWGDDAIKERTLHSMPDMGTIQSYWRRCADLTLLIETMLKKDVHERPTVRECMDDPFFQKRVKGEDNWWEERISPEVVTALKTLSERNKQQRVMLKDLAAKRNLKELKVLNNTFDAMDADHDGVVTAEEARAALEGQMDQDSLDQAVDRLVGPDGKVAYTAFMGQLLASKATDENFVIWREFQAIDDSCTGYLEKDEAARVLERPGLAHALGRRNSRVLVDEMTADGDGHIVFEEFRRALNEK